MNYHVDTLHDFYTFSVKGYGNDWRTVVRNFLRLDPDLFTEMPYGGNGGYAKSAVYNDIRVFYNGREALDEYEQITYPMGVCVSMSGNGCRTFEGNCERYQMIDLFAFLLPYVDRGEVNITRLDIAADDKSGILSMDDIILYILKRKLNCRFNKAKLLTDVDLSNLEDGFTVYIGSDKSSFRFRIYDKAAEQRSKGIDYKGHWIRVEMVCRDEYALGAVRKLVEMRDNPGECIAGMIRSRLDFIELDHTRRTNCTVAEWWDKFLNAVQAIEFYYKEKPVHTADRLKNWISDSLSASLATAHHMFGDNFILTVLKDGRRRLSKFQMALVNDYFNSQGLTPPYIEDFKEFAIEVQESFNRLDKNLETAI